MVSLGDDVQQALIQAHSGACTEAYLCTLRQQAGSKSAEADLASSLQLIKEDNQEAA